MCEKKPPAVGEPPVNTTGDGIRSLKTSGVFRTLNFELYTKPNKWVMGFGLVAITGCFAYLTWLRSTWKEQNLYTAMDENEQLVLRKKKSRWE